MSTGAGTSLVVLLAIVGAALVVAIGLFALLAWVVLRASSPAQPPADREPIAAGPSAPRAPLAPLASPGVDPILEAIRAGKKIEAIKLHRERTGLGLKESMDAVEALARGEGALPPPGAPPASATPDGLSPQALESIRARIRSGNKIEAIKLYREATRVGLKEAKDAVDALERA